MISILISGTSDKPLYRQITEQLRSAIIDGKIAPGDSLPSIRSLAAELSISVITTKRAYDELEAEGLIETIPGRGCFAAGNNELLREKRLKMLEALISDLLRQADYLEISMEELTEMLHLLKEEQYASGS